MFCVLYFCFLFYVFSVFVLFCALFLLLHIAVCFLFSYKFTDRCHRVETQLQYVYIYIYIYIHIHTHTYIFFQQTEHAGSRSQDTSWLPFGRIPLRIDSLRLFLVSGWQLRSDHVTLYRAMVPEITQEYLISGHEHALCGHFLQTRHSLSSEHSMLWYVTEAAFLN